MEGITEALNNHLMTEVLALDLTKAFDCVLRELLLAKLEHYGVRGTALKIFESYLNERTQLVIWKNNMSALKEMNIGVPQGSILGPLLFIIYVNDLPENIPCHSTHLYADDTSILSLASSHEALRDSSASSLKSAESWFSANGLKINISKTQNLKFELNNSTNNKLDILGITFENNMCWNSHISSLTSKLSTALYSMRRMIAISSREICKTTYYANFHSIATYGILLWGHAAGLKRVLLKQKEALRILNGISRTTSCREYFKKEGILTVTSVYILTCLKYVQHNKNRFLRNSDCHDYYTRNRNDLVISYNRLKSTQVSANYWCLKFYNKIPDALKTLPPEKFTRELKRLLVKNTFYTIDEFLNCQFS